MNCQDSKCWKSKNENLVWVKVVKRDEFVLCPQCGRVTQHFHGDRVDDVTVQTVQGSRAVE